MEHLRCVVERITYQNADNGYTVLKCAVKNYSDLVTVVGTMPDTHVGSVLFLEGMWKMDAKYGRQFSVEKFEETLPAFLHISRPDVRLFLLRRLEGQQRECPKRLVWKPKQFTGYWNINRRRGIRRMKNIRWKEMC